jgi:hypothetical protein
MLEAKLAFLNIILNVVVVYINVFYTFIIALGTNKLDRRFIVAVELN